MIVLSPPLPHHHSLIPNPPKKMEEFIKLQRSQFAEMETALPQMLELVAVLDSYIIQRHPPVTLEDYIPLLNTYNRLNFTADTSLALLNQPYGTAQPHRSDLLNHCASVCINYTVEEPLFKYSEPKHAFLVEAVLRKNMLHMKDSLLRCYTTFTLNMEDLKSYLPPVDTPKNSKIKKNGTGDA